MSKPKCSRVKANGEPCGLHPIRGGTTCHKHGLNKRHRAAAQLRLVEQDARAAMRKQGYEIDANEDPLEVLIRVSQETLAFKDFVKERVDQLNEIRYEGGPGAGEQLRAEVRLYADLLRDVTRAFSVIVKLNIAERLAKITEQRAVNIARAVELGLNDSNLTPEQIREVRPHVARHLRAITSG